MKGNAVPNDTRFQSEVQHVPIPRRRKVRVFRWPDRPKDRIISGAAALGNYINVDALRVIQFVIEHIGDDIKLTSNHRHLLLLIYQNVMPDLRMVDQRVSVAWLAQESGLKPKTVSNLMTDLRKRNLVHTLNHSGGSKPATYWVPIEQLVDGLNGFEWD